MADAQTLREIADRVEKLSEPDREIDAVIAYALGWRHVSDGHMRGWEGPDRKRQAALPCFTGSLDAALTLVPEDHAHSVQFSAGTLGEAWLYPPDNFGDREFYSKAASMPLALTAAALRALAASQEQRRG